MREPPQQEESNHGYEKFFKKNWTRRRQKDQSFMPDLVSESRADGGVDLWILLKKQTQKLQQQQMQRVEAKRKAAEQEERAIEIGKSVSQLRMRLTNTAKESEAKVLDEKSLNFADEETKMAYQASGRNRGGSANNAGGAQANSGDGDVRADGGRHEVAHLHGRGR